MTDQQPELLTLLKWSQQQIAGRHCAAWVAWRAAADNRAAEEADGKWRQIEAAENLLEGSAPTDTTDLGAGDVAEYLDGRLSPAAARQVEEACWNSPAQLCEVASGARFNRESGVVVEVSHELSSRLMALGTGAKPSQGGRAFNLAAADPPPAPVPATSHSIAVKPISPASRRPTGVRVGWPAVAAAVLIAAVISGTIGWLGAISRQQRPNGPSLAHERPHNPPATGKLDPSPENRVVAPAPVDARRREPAPQPLPHKDQSTDPPANLATSQPAYPSENPPIDGPNIGPEFAPEFGKMPPPGGVVVRPPEAAIQSAMGAVLVDPGHVGPLRLGQGQYSLDRPLRLVSLAESWTSVEVPGVGTLIFDGPAEATLASWGDGALELELVHGKLGVQGLAAGTEVRFHTGGVVWQVRGLGNYSTLAVMHDPVAPHLYVPIGSVAVNEVAVTARQVLRFVAGAAQPPQALAVGAPSLADDVLSDKWLAMPDEPRRQRWKALHGALLESLATAEDASTELPKLVAASRDPRQTALLARWNVSVGTQAEQVERLWVMLADRREAVRVAAVRHLVALPAGDQRQANFVRFVRSELTDALGQRVAQWLRSAQAPGQIPATEAVELAEFLDHRELAFRQLAASLLEMHAAPALERARRAAPAYDAAGSPAKRAAAQRQWRLLIRQLFAPARNRAAVGPNALAPNAAPPP